MVPFPFFRTRLFGPLLLYDLVRTARRRQCVVVRCLYLALLLTVLVGVSATWAFQHDKSVWVLFEGAALEPREVSDLAAVFFYFFLVAQVAAVFLLTPVYVAGAIGEEKDHRTLEFLLATGLRSREVVLSLVCSRLANLVLVLLAGLPFLSLLKLLGGVDPDLLLAGFGFSGLTMLGLAGVAAACSVSARRAREAIVRTYVWAVTYLALSGMSWLLVVPVLEWAQFPSTPTWTSPVTVQDAVEWFNAGNPVAVAVRCMDGLKAGTPLDEILPGCLRAYAWFQGLVTAACVLLAIARLRAASESETEAAEDCPSARSLFLLRPLGLFARRYRPPVGDRPMLWKELLAERGRLHNVGRIAIGLLVLASFLPPAGIVYWALLDGRWPDPRDYQEGMNLWVRFASALIGLLMLLQVALRAAGAISCERDRHTLDGLLATPLSAPAILWAKLLGALLAPRKSVLWLGAILLIGFLTQALDVYGALWFVIAWLVFAIFLAGLGLCFSVASRTTLQAVFRTFLTTTGLWGGHWLLWIALVPIADWNMASGGGCEWLGDFQKFGMTPPFTLFVLPSCRPEGYYVGDIEVDRSDAKLAIIQFALLLWALGAVLCWILARSRFYRDVARVRGSSGSRRGQAVAAAPGGGQRQGNGLTAAAPSAVPLTMALPGAAGATAGTGKPLAPAGPVTLARTNEAAESKKRRRARRRRRRAVLAAVGLLGLGLGIVGYLALSARPEGRLKAAVKEAELLDPGWRVEELLARRKAIPDDCNGTQVVRQAFRAVRKMDSLEVIYISLYQNLAPEVQLDEEQTALIKSELSEAGEGVEQARRLAELPDGRYPIELSKDGISTELPPVHPIRMVGTLLALDAVSRGQEEPVRDGALESSRALFNMATSCGDEPFLMCLLVRLAYRHNALQQTERALAQTRPSERALAEFQQLLEREEPRPILLNAIRGERGLLDRLLHGMQVGEIPFAEWPDHGLRGTGNAPGSELVFRLAVGSVKTNRAAALRYMNRAVETAKLPIEQQEAEVKKLETTLPQQQRLVRQLIPAQGNVVKANTRHLAELRCAIVMLAAERYRLIHGTWPGSPKDLVPGQLGTVPSDPFNGEPLRYSRLKDGAVIYSVGPDGVDDGGVLDRNLSGNYGTDIGFRLWDVARRRQLAPPRTAPGGLGNSGPSPAAPSGMKRPGDK